MFIDENTSREDLLTAVYQEKDLIDHFIKNDLDPENMPTGELYEFICSWMLEGNECTGY